jgi:hypothetical protein
MFVGMAGMMVHTNSLIKKYEDQKLHSQEKT